MIAPTVRTILRFVDHQLSMFCVVLMTVFASADVRIDTRCFENAASQQCFDLRERES